MLTRRIAVAAVATALVLAAGADLQAKKKKSGGKKEKMSGYYTWEEGGDRDTVSAEFSANGEDEWKVKFYIVWRGEMVIFDGEAKGSLTEGSLRGFVKGHPHGRQRTFTFSGMFDETGTLYGTHLEVRGKVEIPTGTIVLKH